MLAAAIFFKIIFIYFDKRIAYIKTLLYFYTHNLIHKIMKAQKLIAEYRTKISACEKTIESLTISIREARKNNESEGVIDDLYSDKKTENAKMQLMIQFCKDIEDIA